MDDRNSSPIGFFNEGKKPAIARKELAECTAWFVGLPDPGAMLLDYILHQTPAHFFGSDKEIFYVGSGMVIMHTGKAGMHKIALKNGGTVEYQVPEGGATVIFDAETGEVLTR